MHGFFEPIYFVRPTLAYKLYWFLKRLHSVTLTLRRLRPPAQEYQDAHSTKREKAVG